MQTEGSVGYVLFLELRDILREVEYLRLVYNSVFCIRET